MPISSRLEVSQISSGEFFNAASKIYKLKPDRVSFGAQSGVAYLEGPTVSLGAEMCFSGVVETMGGRLALFHKHDTDPGREIKSEIGPPRQGTCALNLKVHTISRYGRSFADVNITPFILRQPWFWQDHGSNINLLAGPDGEVYFAFGNMYLSNFK